MVDTLFGTNTKWMIHAWPFNKMCAKVLRHVHMSFFCYSKWILWQENFLWKKRFHETKIAIQNQINRYDRLHTKNEKNFNDNTIMWNLLISILWYGKICEFMLNKIIYVDFAFMRKQLSERIAFFYWKQFNVIDMTGKFYGFISIFFCALSMDEK